MSKNSVRVPVTCGDISVTCRVLENFLVGGCSRSPNTLPATQITMASMSIYAQAARFSKPASLRVSSCTGLSQGRALDTARHFSSTPRRRDELDDIYDNFNKKVSEKKPVRSKSSDGKKYPSRTNRDTNYSQQSFSSKPRGKTLADYEEADSHSGQSSRFKGPSQRSPNGRSRNNLNSDRRPPSKSTVDHNKELYRTYEEKEIRDRVESGEHVTLSNDEFSKVRDVMRASYKDQGESMRFDVDSFFNYKDEKGYYRPINVSTVLFDWEKKQARLDKDPAYANEKDPHVVFFKQLNDWEERRKRARMRKSGYKFPEEHASYVPPEQLSDPSKRYKGASQFYLNPAKIDFEKAPSSGKDEKAPVLQHNLDRVLFSPGIHILKDKRTNVYNFSPSLESVMSIRDFDFTKVTPFIPSANDTKLSETAKENKKLFTSSTSSLTGILMHLHFLISRNRPPVTQHLSKNFPATETKFTTSMRKPISAFLRYRPETDTYSLDSDKTQDEDMILSLLGQVMETQLTVDSDTFLKEYTKPLEGETPKSDTPTTPQTNVYHYSTCGDFVMRSQIDCYDPRLPGTGTFDLKTRAACAVRHDLDYAQVHDGSDYQINKIKGEWESYEREQYDLIRSALLKYSLQARIGRMDGIFVAYHNIRKMFGFEYLPLGEIDKIFHGYNLQDADAQAPKIADSEFRMSITILSNILKQVVAEFPKQSVNLVFKAPSTQKDIESHGQAMMVFAHPMPESIVDLIQRGIEPPPESKLKTVPTIEEVTDQELMQQYADQITTRQQISLDRKAKTAGKVAKPAPVHELSKENLAAERARYADTLKTKAYLNRRTLFDLYRDDFLGPNLGLKAWRVVVDNYVDRKMLPAPVHPTPGLDNEWTLGVKMESVSQMWVSDYLDSVIYGFLNDIMSESRKVQEDSEKLEAKTQKEGYSTLLQESFSEKEMEVLDEEKMEDSDRLSIDELEPRQRAQHLIVNPPKVIQAANSLKAVSGEAGSASEQPLVKKGSRLTSRPDTVRRSQEEIAKYIESGLEKMEEPSEFQKLLRTFDQKGRMEQRAYEDANGTKAKIVWAPKPTPAIPAAEPSSSSENKVPQEKGMAKQDVKETN